jgi:hypothetical protein
MALGKIAIGTSQKIYDAICLPFYLLNILWYRRSAGGEHFAKYIQVINYAAIINVQHQYFYTIYIFLNINVIALIAKNLCLKCI